MASFIPVKVKKLMDVKLGESPNWILMWDFTPKALLEWFKEEELKHEQLHKYH
ncbi:unnamed protein product [Nyctereutes procyonoides]|uniref:(raccoon dog) hypothetical protein n=1 Tax=Nyctereutes procyonoides TaxID=34880 RepID=A0A811ZPV6_NYCPR|nr:unnamed protein product [Nyctereutes procyonoides]